MENNFTPVRIFFEKRGRSKYISHLDLSRCMQRAIKRSGLPVWYTQGFHPHLYLTFALPISLGYESLQDSMDIRLTAPVETQQLLDDFNAALPEGIRALRAAAPVMKPDKIAWGEYRVSVHLPGHSREELLRGWEAFAALETVTVLKRTKRGEKEMDIRPFFTVQQAEAEDGRLHLVLLVAAGGTLNINPALITDAYCTHCGWENEGIDVVRCQLYTETMEIFE